MENQASAPYISLDEASRKYGLPRKTLTRAIEHGTISSVQYRMDILLDEGDVRMLVPVDESLRGKPIRVTEAARKYVVEQSNLTRWADYGYIRILERRNKLLVLDEADVKRAAEIFRRAIDSTGSPIRAGWILKRVMSTPIN